MSPPFGGPGRKHGDLHAITVHCPALKHKHQSTIFPCSQTKPKRFGPNLAPAPPPSSAKSRNLPMLDFLGFFCRGRLVGGNKCAFWGNCPCRSFVGAEYAGVPLWLRVCVCMCSHTVSPGYLLALARKDDRLRDVCGEGDMGGT